MSKKNTAISQIAPESNDLADLLEQYGCGPIQFTGTNDALYERHLIFDNVVHPERCRPARAV